MTIKVTQETQKQYEHAYMLVGRFMSHWSILEGSVNEGVGKLLGMDTLEATIATANMQLRSKVHILKAVVDLKCGSTPWGKAAIKDIERVATLADTWRNIVAHVGFVPHDDGVKFLAVKARGKLAFPETIRNGTEFLIVSGEITQLAARIDEIVVTLTTKKRGKTLGDLLVEYANAETPQPETENFLGRLLLGSQGSHPPTNEVSPQTLQEPEAK